ncbi:hypothetical protein RhiirC2_791506 [Rhizophagus irregularis]|uniref:Uncharacterized protein n=1 Tax=Rhizophagus irregularis TaxID=588596 RepID=A0A2N1MJ36_9GLOM|nr:hypothetical protein RhiirC2_791506 [Rhizophagus irregularis]
MFSNNNNTHSYDNTHDNQESISYNNTYDYNNICDNIPNNNTLFYDVYKNFLYDNTHESLPPTYDNNTYYENLSYDVSLPYDTLENLSYDTYLPYDTCENFSHDINSFNNEHDNHSLTSIVHEIAPRFQKLMPEMLVDIEKYVIQDQMDSASIYPLLKHDYSDQPIYKKDLYNTVYQFRQKNNPGDTDAFQMLELLMQ